MPDKIEPALSAEEWNLLMASNDGEPTPYVSYHGPRTEKVIAEANYRLPASDPRKITRAAVASLYLLVKVTEGIAHSGHTDRLRNLANALASYLQPETP